MIKETAKSICNIFDNIEQIRSYKIYGSLSKDTYDIYSDIDIEIDVSGIDNSLFIKEIPNILSKKYDLYFIDFAPSLVPSKYIVSMAISLDNPFMVVDISCVANPFFTTLGKSEVALLNNQYEHILKLFVVNLKHFLRYEDCYKDIKKMYLKVFDTYEDDLSEYDMLLAVFTWLDEDSNDKQKKYLQSLREYIKKSD